MAAAAGAERERHAGERLGELPEPPRHEAVLRVGALRPTSVGWPRCSLEAVRADEAVAGEVLRRGVQRRQGAHVLALGEEAVPDGPQDVHEAAARAATGGSWRRSRVDGHRADRRSRLGEAALELRREQEVRELRLAVGAPRVVGAALPVEVVEVDLADPVAGRGDRDDAVGDLREQQVREREVAEVVRADLHLEAVGGAPPRESP